MTIEAERGLIVQWREERHRAKKAEAALGDALLQIDHYRNQITEALRMLGKVTHARPAGRILHDIAATLLHVLDHAGNLKPNDSVKCSKCHNSPCICKLIEAEDRVEGGLNAGGQPTCDTADGSECDRNVMRWCPNDKMYACLKHAEEEHGACHLERPC